MKRFFSIVLILTCVNTAFVFAQHQKIDSLLKVLPDIEDERQRIDLLNELAFQYLLISVNDADKVVQDAIAKSRAISYKKGLAESLKILGIIHFVKNEYGVAVEYDYQSLKLYEELNDLSGQSKVLNNLSLLFSKQNQFDKARDFSLKSLKLKREIGDSVGVVNSLIALSEYYRNAKDYAKAQYLGQLALDRCQTMKYNWGVSYAYLALGELYADQENYTSAARYFKDAVRYARLTNDHMQIVTANNKLGQLFLNSQQYDSAYYFLHTTIALARQKNTRSQEMEALKSLSIYFERMGHLDSALYFTRQVSALERIIFENERREQIASIQMLYDFEKKEQELEFQHKIVRRQYIAIGGVSIILVLSILLGFKFYGLNKTNHLAKEALIKLNVEINKMNENLEMKVQERTEEIARQNQKLIEYAFFTAHEVRGPLARILGLVELARIRELVDDREEILDRLQDAAHELDEIIRIINRKLESSRHL
ncbi:MAG TPA: tetratricopeptide repeat protein [Ohtaekwangia sp.]|uniref:tetratricopeptide repeat protein n=1 Tax=Ohtaekwangia sp. TaxID=2066019 RepID=UPI002F9342CD